MVMRVVAGDRTDREAYGSSDIVLRAGGGDLPLSVAVVAGDHQFAPIGKLLSNPIVVRVVRADGTPAAGQQVSFGPGSVNDTLSGIETFGIDPATLRAVTDVNGLAVSNPAFAGWAPGNRSISVTTFDADQGVSVSASAGFTVLNADGRDTISLQNLWWSGTLENGWGMSVVQHADALFGVVFVYDEQGNPTWYVIPDGAWIRGVGSSFSGALYTTRGAPLWAYDASRLRVTFAGTGSVAFRGAASGSLALNVGRVSQVKDIVPQDFTGSAPSPITGLGDMWWGGPEQNGWGIAILEQFGGLFAVWFTYDDAGLPTWFVMPGGEWRDSSTYAGTIYQTTGSPWLGATYDPSRLRVSAAGPFTLRFVDAGHATFDYGVRGRSGRLTLTRQPF